jgi:hypothetical protein
VTSSRLKHLLRPLAVCLLTACGTMAQTAIFNAPSTDTQDADTTNISADLSAHFASYRKGGFATYGPSMIHGLRDDLELGLNLYFTRHEGPDAAELQPHIKWRFLDEDKAGIAVAVGSVLFLPLNDAAGSRPHVVLYANAARSFKDLRLTAGGYHVAGAEEGFGNRSGGFAGLEKPLNDKITFVADWISGNNKLGHGTAGIRFAVTSAQTLELGYSFGNTRYGNNYLSAFYSFDF